jgi:glucose-6-phosphate 1-epimerase
MRVVNKGDTPLDFTAALHTYLEVADVEKAKVKGLKGLTYLDKVRGGWELMWGWMVAGWADEG